jgi:hypothetical protein
MKKLQPATGRPVLISAFVACLFFSACVRSLHQPVTRHKVLTAQNQSNGSTKVKLSGLTKKVLLQSDTLKVGDSITVNWIKFSN